MRLLRLASRSWKSHKQGLMQKLFPAEGKSTPTLRFPEFRNVGTWSLELFSDFVKERNVRSSVSNMYPCLTSSRLGMFLQEKYFSKQVASKDNAGYKIIKQGDFTFRSMSDDGIFFFNRQNLVAKGLVSPAYAVFSASKKVNADWLYYLLNSAYFRRILASKVQGTTRIALKMNILNKIQVSAPSLSEQQKIARCLSAADELIATCEQKLEALKGHKQGLMQQLFPRGEE